MTAPESQIIPKTPAVQTRSMAQPAPDSGSGTAALTSQEKCGPRRSQETGILKTKPDANFKTAGFAKQDVCNKDLPNPEASGNLRMLHKFEIRFAHLFRGSVQHP